MTDLIGYVLQFGKQPLARLPLTTIDGVVLAQLAYFDFTGSGRLGDLSVKDRSRLTEGTWRPAKNAALLTAMASSPRYADIIFHDRVDQLDLAQEKQFSALALTLPDDTEFLTFRGTRAAFVDWKEDFNMAYLPAIPSQQAALHYFRRLAEAAPDRDFWLGGHSKGGSLATYAFVHSHTTLQARVRGVFNADGPGIAQVVDPALTPRIHKLVPQTSMIGTLFDPGQDYHVVASSAHGIGQHDPFTWAIDGLHFRRLPHLDPVSQVAQRTIAAWVADLDDATKAACLNAAYQLITQTEAETFDELKEDWPQKARRLLTGLRAQDPDVYRNWRHALGALIIALRASIPQPHLPQAPEWWPWK
ncbi:Mbeg1-like protein [Lacticaseibacillus mingshuiensis]|uniref:Mbeg1-like protein n=1 Tax=Lacticaseibacillus mingshuiensis TaxID=2799574 RepID=A0ABW4CHR4_9LACO|nr:Mbeg1-like protein [Lacticaseibacillus mingshuiensis]